MKRVILSFFGGHQDGRRLDSHSPDPGEASQAGRWYIATEYGCPGKAVVGPSYAAVQYCLEHGLEAASEAGIKRRHEYRITDRRETEEAIHLRLEYRLVDEKRQ